ncbi:hypothetical protein [Klenkia sp. PcliD-1-E]|uniref:hypothetical protein n=1 Tax=Klenkia sp. PcliD-1-E TaxID=2954492 RepID=UPI002096CEEE|nr:hypothetical protein [Klenkia sp. PcliD-1-E]MCO7220229.1 hypothetical protein [Klenkia sp. PcliD-1-E]
MGANVREVLRQSWWLLVLGLLTGLAVALTVGLLLGSNGADLVITAVAGLLAGNAGGLVAAVVLLRRALRTAAR